MTRKNLHRFTTSEIVKEKERILRLKVQETIINSINYIGINRKAEFHLKICVG